ncbi:MAG: ERCC4 domain-containing protein [candidate division NC10 bacterium]
MTTPEFVVAVDTREQKPYRFKHSEVKTLPTGDYSIVGLEEQVAVERKHKADAYASLGQGRARFERELERLAAFDYAAIVVETTLPDFLTAPPFSQMNPKAAMNSLVAWSVKYRVCVFFAGDRAHGNALTYRLLEKYWRYRQERADKSSAS